MKTELCSRHKGWIFASVAAIKYINSDVCFQFLQTRSWKRLREGEQGVENTSTCLICVGRYCHTAATGSLWEVPSCYRILLPMQITEFVKYYYKIVNWLCWEVLCLSSKAVFLWLSNDFQTVSVCLAEMSTDLSHLCVQCVAILFAEQIGMFMASYGVVQETSLWSFPGQEYLPLKVLNSWWKEGW